MSSLALLIVRLVLGVIFIYHGSQKVFGWFGGSGTSGMAKSLANQGSAFPSLLAWMAALSEFLGGLFVFVGLLTPFAAAFIISAMIVAIVTVHFKKGFANGKGGYEFNLSLIALALVLVLLGAGSYSIDALIGLAQPLNQFPIWVAVILVLIAAGGIVTTELSKSLHPQTHQA
ncbi:MAG TPA: DoxX family protein [Phototrophicaceae bacterium]|nr:DoxX family protein [Phototrophicaceae bacterium]